MDRDRHDRNTCRQTRQWERLLIGSTRVVISLAALPAPGSVMQMAGLSPARTSPAASRFWGSLPYFHDGADGPHIRLDDDAPGYATAFRHLLDNQDCIEITATATAIIERNGRSTRSHGYC
jgi:hypothetical protein